MRALTFLVIALAGTTAMAQGGSAPVVAGERTALAELLEKPTRCWLAEAKVWTFGVTAVAALRRPGNDPGRMGAGARRILPKGVPLWCFAEEPEKAKPELKALVKASRFLTVMKDTDTHQCAYNDIAGTRVVDDPWSKQQGATEVAEPCDKYELRLKQAGVPEQMIKEITQYLK